MKKLLNTLYVTTPETYLRLEGETVIILRDDSELGQIPLINLSAIVCFGYRGVSPSLMGYCAEHGIDLSFITPHGRFLARINGPVRGNVLLREAQTLLAADTMRSLEPAKAFISAKLYNCRTVLERTVRDHEHRIDAELFAGVIDQHRRCISELQTAEDIGTVMGIEGAAAKAYFSVFGQMILRNRNDFPFEDRNRRPPTDRVNALLSFAYTLLTNEICGALESVGLDPYIGYLHQKRPGRCSLALDFLEEFRASYADRFVLSQINLGTLTADDFDVKENGAVFLRDDARSRFLKAWQSKKSETLTHPFLREKVQWGLVPYAQAMLFSRWLRGDLDAYPPFFWK